MSNQLTTESENASPRSRFFERYKGASDEYGFDIAAYQGGEQFLRFLYKKWFRVQIAGLENIPSDGSAVLFGNHSGVLPLDGALLYDGIINQHPAPRRVRFLVTKFLLKAKMIGDFLRGFGCVPPDFEVMTKLLEQDELVAIFPEAEDGTGKLFKDRYQLVDFHAGFVRAAIATGSPLVPIVTIGGEEIYPMFADVKPLAKWLRFPYFPLTPFFPWMPFPLNLTPVPVKIMMCVWPSFKLDYPPEAAEDTKLMQQLADDIRRDLQGKVSDLLAMRTSPFAAWDMSKVDEYLASTTPYKSRV